MSRVIETDNFNGDYPNEQWACPYSLREDQAVLIATLFNALMSGRDAPRWWKAVPDDYKLKPGFEP